MNPAEARESLVTYWLASADESLASARSEQSAGSLLTSLDKVIQCQAGIAHDLTQQSPTDIKVAMYGNGCSATVRMSENGVAAGLTHFCESMELQEAHDLTSRKSRKARAHTATRTRETPTSWPMGSPRSKRSSR